MRKTIILIIAAVLACTAIVYAGAKSYAQKDEAMIQLQEQLIAEQNKNYETFAEQYRLVDLQCSKDLNNWREKMDKAHNLAEAYRATIKALNHGQLDFSLPQNQ